MVRATTFSQPMLSAAYIRLLADVVSRWGISVDALLEGSGLNADDLLQPDLRVEAPLFSDLSQKAIRLTGEAGLSIHMGLQMKVTGHGIIGIAALMAKNLGEAIEIASQYISLLSSFIALRLEIEGEYAVVYVEETLPRYPLTDFGLLLMVIGCITMANTMTGQIITGYADMRIAKPNFFERFAAQLSNPFNFNQPLSRIVFAKSYLDLPLVMADPTSARMAREQRPFGIGELSKRTGVPVKTLRYYSDEGLLPPAGRTASRYRVYGEDAVARVDLIRTLRDAGVGLDRIRAVLARERSMGDVLRMQLAVVEAHLRYRAPAKYDDVIAISAQPSEPRAASVDSAASASRPSQ